MSTRPLVYVVDDEEPIRGALRVLLRASGFTVTTCASGAEALSAIEGAKPACVLTDYHMPGMDGSELIQAIRSAHPDIHLVLMTGRDESSQVDQLEDVRVVAKPFDANQLLDTLRSMMPTV
jgi:two-component system KDP operon response regulator KdpE